MKKTDVSREAQKVGRELANEMALVEAGGGSSSWDFSFGGSGSSSRSSRSSRSSSDSGWDLFDWSFNDTFDPEKVKRAVRGGRRLREDLHDLERHLQTAESDSDLFHTTADVGSSLIEAILDDLQHDKVRRWTVKQIVVELESARGNLTRLGRLLHDAENLHRKEATRLRDGLSELLSS